MFGPSLRTNFENLYVYMKIPSENKNKVCGERGVESLPSSIL